MARARPRIPTRLWPRLAQDAQPSSFSIFGYKAQNSTGLQLLKIVKEQNPMLPVVMISGHGNIETAVSAIKLGAYDFIEKPFKADRLVLVAERALEASRLKREVTELRTRAGGANRSSANPP